MKCHGVLLLCLLLLSNMQSLTQVICEGEIVIFSGSFDQCDSNPWVLIFEENFNGNSLDLCRWGYGPHIRYCNSEQQYYSYGDNTEVSNGTLKLIAKKETLFAKAVDWLPEEEHLFCNGTDKGQNARFFYYTSANIETIKRFFYGKYEARVKIPKGKGFWPAFWMWGQDPIYNEIDVFEFWNENNLWGYDPSKLSRVHKMNVHYDYDGDGDPSDCPTKYEGDDFSCDFHIFTVDWEKDKIKWYVDGDLKRTDFQYYTILGQTTSCTIKAFYPYLKDKIYTTDPMQIILNFAIQDKEDSPDGSVVFPSQMEVDWVKYYQRNPCKNVIITDASQYPLDNQLYNAIIGRNVSVSCRFEVLESQQLDILTKNRIMLEAGFDAKSGSSFIARIEPSVCDVSQTGESANILKDTLIAHKDFNEAQNSEKYIRNEDIQLFPNPSDGSIIVDFGSMEYWNFSIFIRNNLGNLIESNYKINSAKVIFDLSSYPKGLYFLYLLDNQNKSVTTHKLIII